MIANKRMPWSFGLAMLVLAGAPAVPGMAQDKVQAGVSAAVKGEIQIASLGGAGVGRIARSGEEIYLADQISSGDNAGMQVLLLDETVFTIGAQSAITIDEFVYNPATQSGAVAARVVKGAFRFVTGQIAKRQPQAMAVKLPVGAIGIRGTIAAGRVDGNSSLVVLLGPGANTNTDERVGRILVSNAGKTVEISRVGFATMIDGLNTPPVEPFQLPAADLKALTQSLDQGNAPRKQEGTGGSGTQKAAPQNQNGGQQRQQNAGNASRQQNTPSNGTANNQQQNAPSNGTANNQQQAASSNNAVNNQGNQRNASVTPSSGGLNSGNTGNLAGENQVAATQNANNPISTGAASKEGDRLVNDATQGDPVSQLPRVQDGITSFDELRRLNTGTHSFVVETAFVQNQINGTSTNLPGNMRFQLDIDFGARTVGGGGSSVSVNTTGGGGNIDFTSPIAQRDYLKDKGLVDKVLQPGGGDPKEVQGSRVQFRNGNGVIAQTMRVDVKYSDAAGNQGSGAGESGPRVK